MSEYKNIIYTEDENITQIQFNRSNKLNALTKNMWLELLNALDKALLNKTKVIVFFGNEKAFSAGDDIPSMYELNNEKESDEFFSILDKTFHLLINSEKPLIGGVNGIAFGGGFEILFFMDIVIATKNSKFALPEAKLGLIPPIALTVGCNLFGLKQINRLALTGETIGVFEANKIGIVDCVVEENQLRDKVLEVAWKIMDNSNNSVSFIKKWSNNYKIKKEEISNVMHKLSELALTEEAKNRMLKFIEKNKKEISLFC